ncbi:MAG: C25 family cysteine peptidase [Candidatus Gastranaerophilaceae bacterium]
MCFAIIFILPIYLFGQDSLFLKCADLPGFGIKSSINLEEYLTINIDDDNYNVEYSLNLHSLNFRDTTIGNLSFFEIQLPQSRYIGYENIIGQPKLPIINFSLQIPGVLYGENFLAENITCNYEEISVDNYYLPYQDFVGEKELEFSFNVDYYSTSHQLNNYVSIVPFKAGRTTGINVLLKPIQYNPAIGKVRIINSISFDIPLENAELSDIFAYEFLDSEAVIDASFLGEDTQLPINSNPNGNILIVIADEEYRSNLNSFTLHKSTKGYSTEIVSIDQINGTMGTSNITAEVLRTYLRNKYYSTYIPSRPKYLLLVGGYNAIPCSSEGEDLGGHFYTDLYYGCLNSLQIQQESDLYPEMYVGRWPIDSIHQLNTAINKTIKFENSLGDYPAFYNIMMVSGIEDSLSNSNKDDDMFATISGMQQSLNQGSLFQNIDVYDGRNYRGNVGTNAIQNILNQKMLSDLWMFVYWGHGSTGSLGLPLSVKDKNINSYVYSSIPPIALSFACLTNRISGTDCYGKSWLVKQQDAGGVVHYGATGEAFWNLTKQLALTIANLLKANEKMSIALPLQVGAAKLYAKSNTESMRNQAEKFCIYGDPTLLMFKHSNSIVPQQNSKHSEQKEIALLTVDLLNEYIGFNNVSVNVYDMNGKLILMNNDVNLNFINMVFNLPM